MIILNNFDIKINVLRLLKLGTKINIIIYAVI